MKLHLRLVSLKFVLLAAAAMLLADVGLPRPAVHVSRQQTVLPGASVPPDVGEILSRACQDCHSDKTVWPWYAHLPPMSGLIAKDVREGRAFLNLSNWGQFSKGRKIGYLMAMSSAAAKGEMPPGRYTLIHGDARLSERERLRIAAWATEEAARVRAGRSAADY